MGKSYLLTGEPGIGKTTVLRKIVGSIGIGRCGGFYTQEIRSQGIRTGFQVVTLDGQSGTIADVSYASRMRVGKYGVDINVLEAIGITAIYEAIEHKELVIVDEIGPMQLYSSKFKQAVIDAVRSTRPLLGTIVSRPWPWADELKLCPSIETHHITASNRDSVVDKLVSILSTILSEHKYPQEKSQGSPDNLGDPESRRWSK